MAAGRRPGLLHHGGHQRIKPLVEDIKKNANGEKPGKVSADSGYFSETNVEYLEAEEIDGFIATSRTKA